MRIKTKPFYFALKMKQIDRKSFYEKWASCPTIGAKRPPEVGNTPMPKCSAKHIFMKCSGQVRNGHRNYLTFVELNLQVKVTAKVKCKQRNGRERAKFELIRFWMTLDYGVKVTTKVKGRKQTSGRRRFAVLSAIIVVSYAFPTDPILIILGQVGKA